MCNHATSFLLAVLLLGPACDVQPPRPMAPAGHGKIAIAWTLDGAYFDLQRCQKLGIDYMEVAVQQVAGEGLVGYTEVRCDLDRYSLEMTPEGQVQVTVSALRKDARGRTCLVRGGAVLLNAGRDYPPAPTAIELKYLGDCR